MKYQPLYSPIRYALIAHPQLKPERAHHEEALYRQLTSWLMHNPITLSNLRIKFGFYDQRQYGMPSASIARLDPENDWQVRAERHFEDLVPNLSGFTHGKQDAFAFGLYSYQGGSEMPLFARAYAIEDPATSKKSIDEKIEVLGQRRIRAKSIHKESLRIWNESYEKLMRNEMSEAEFWERKRGVAEPVYVTAPYSYIWEALDSGYNNGILPPHSDTSLRQLVARDEVKEKEVEKKDIQLVVCRSHRALFYEEFYRIYKASRHCKACGAALRSRRYKGEYCHKNDNPACWRNRQTSYKRRQRQTAASRAAAKAKKLS